MTSSSEKFEFFLSEKQQFLVVSLTGSLTKATSAELQNCETAILASQATCIVLNFHDVVQIDLTAIRPLVQMQKLIREKPAQLKICFLKTQHFDLLDGAAAIRAQEVCSDLVQALKSFDIRPNKP